MNLLELVPLALEIVKALTQGEVDDAAQKAKALSQALLLKQTTRAAAHAAVEALKKD